MFKILLLTITILFMLYVLVTLFIFFKIRNFKGFKRERMLSFFNLVYPIKDIRYGHNNINHEIEEVNIDGLTFKINYYWKGNNRPTKAYLFHSGINTGYISSFKVFNFLVDQDYLCISYDSRGWGDLAQSSICTYSYKEKDDLFEVLKYINNNNNITDLTLHGESMGGSVVVEYLSKYDSKFVNRAIVDSGVGDYKLTVTKALSKLKKWKIVAKLITKPIGIYSQLIDSYNPLKLKPYLNINNIKIDMLFLHTSSDTVVDIENFNLYKKTSKISLHKFVSFDRGYHTNIQVFENEKYMKHYNSFINNK